MHGLIPDKLPRHLAIIMDGNGRWAQERMLTRIIGHQKGVETVRIIVEECSRLGIGYLTLFAFSAENWLRPKTEVKALMALLKKYIASEAARMDANNIRFNVIGNRDELPPDVNKAVQGAIDRTSGNTGMILTLALSYGARQEIMTAATRIASDIASGVLKADDLSETAFASYLFTSGLPDPDFLIRTSGEMRISNFLLWQLAYTEFYFSSVNWPEFTPEELYRALSDYQARERRFGRTSAQINTRS
ncbi:isoprenyl transferase [Geobacter sulfurreducens]|uniref:Isoprenyl transferase n=1 Tax=Geobacter sulfurreducens (strain ATCC 51573 / DSM 12127 / PCA) TaxID=243231 RepID=ISPT_GEOSL|nr:isoprenyl transferase [Geobacter sulfurreducens]P60482.1 RecName: Full=Isoprenyl transferase [Geobacter sulfurreducens PCA]AAR35293.1 undecaprenyl diphosphate synthase [Geobacter sulfurreducens PCA]ADI84755.1 undecaprenyl diphosphate synthase [Geobacter sulfurreducens KN400]AJY68164.1 UDP pyrophosphate synthase [Geobacter sulfurreducens]QVW33870.1 isoprenyl transferase [Geobacter sulfurreducens]UAC02657.1 isoprenyl transferase [Geobacter sulfurreducens]